LIIVLNGFATRSRSGHFPRNVDIGIGRDVF
jgi:hypothetical protein